MRQRDKYILVVLGVVVLIGGFWMLLLSPKRSDLDDINKKVDEKQAAVDKLDNQVQVAQQAKVDFAATYATLARLGKAVPPQGSIDDDIPSMILQVNQGADVTRTKFDNYEPEADQGGAAATPAPAPSGGSQQQAQDTGAGSSGESTSATSAAVLGESKYKVSFRGGFYDLEDLLNYLSNLVKVQGKNLRISGRLISIDSLDFSVDEPSSKRPRMKVEMSFTAYTTSADLLTSAPQNPAGGSGQPQTASDQSSSVDAVPGAPPQAQPATPPAAVKRP